VNSANLTFALKDTTLAPFNFDHPSTDSTYITVTGDALGEISFTGHDSVTIVDLTGGNLTSLSLNTPYLLIKANSSSYYSGLVTELNGVVSLTGADGYVIGVLTAWEQPPTPRSPSAKLAPMVLLR